MSEYDDFTGSDLYEFDQADEGRLDAEADAANTAAVMAEARIDLDEV